MERSQDEAFMAAQEAGGQHRDAQGRIQNSFLHPKRYFQWICRKTLYATIVKISFISFKNENRATTRTEREVINLN
jgi:hypothetical protein